MAIFQAGSVNTAGLVVPGVSVLVSPPKVVKLNGVATNVLGVVGAASWGPVGQRVTLGGYGQADQYFGAAVDRKHDLSSAVFVAELAGAAAFECVRVTDGTDTAAVGNMQTDGLSITAKYTGSKGNGARVALSAGSKAGTWKLVVSLPDQIPEVFDNVAGGKTGNDVWAELARVLNEGDGYRGASNIVTAVKGARTNAPTANTVALAGGTDGATGVNSTTLLGSDGLVRTGMYALRNGDASVLLLVDADDYTTWPAQIAFGLFEGMYVQVAAPMGQSPATTKANKVAAGIDSYGAKIFVGDALYFQDPVSKRLRAFNQATVAAGRITALAPNESSLNKPIQGIVGSQKVGAPGTGIDAGYSDAELQEIINAGLDVITNRSPGGSFWSVRSGTNASSDPAVNGDNYTRMTNFLAETINAGLGRYIGRTITIELLSNIRATIVNFLNNLLQQGLLALTLDGKIPFQVVCDASNNPFERINAGYVQVDVKVTYMSITRFLIVKLEGGQSVSVTIQERAGA